MLRFEVGQELVDAFAQHGVDGLRGDLGEGFQDEPALVQGGVRHVEGGAARADVPRVLIEHRLIVEQQVEVEGACAPVLPLRFGRPTGVTLDGLKPLEQRGGRQSGGHDRGGVQVRPLPGRPDRRGLVGVAHRQQARLGHVTQRPGGLPQRGEPIPEIGPQRDAGPGFIGLQRPGIEA